jgi:peptidyl-prolyl cis-trans isomerase D
MRANKKNQTVIWAILGLLGVGLIGCGGVGAGGGTVSSIGHGGEEQISVVVYAQAMNRALSNLSQQLGRTVTSAEAQAFGVQNNVLQGLLTTAALDNETAELGVSIGDEAVREQLLSNVAFQGLDGNFDKEAYTYTLERTGLSPAEYDDILRKEAARTFLQSAVITGLKSQGSQTKALLAFDRETRDFKWAELTATALDAPIAEPTESQVESHYEATPEAYTAPLTREITYAWLSPKMLSDQVDIDEAQVRESYDLQSDRFNKAEKRSVERIVFGTEEEATAARNLLDAGTATFNTLLADRGLTAEDVDLGEVERGGISTEAADLVFADDNTGIVGPVTSSLGPALFRINVILAEDLTSFEDARAEIVGELAGEAARRLVSDTINDIDDLLAAGDTRETLVQDTEIELGTIDFTADTTDGIAAYENFRTIANTAQPSDFPEINDLADGGIFAIRVDAIKQPALRPLTDVREQVIVDWKQAETIRLLTVKAEQLRADLEAGASFGSLITKTETTLGRSGYIENTPPALLDGIFELDAGKVNMVEGEASVFIGQLDQVNSFDETDPENQALIDAIQQQIDAQVGNDLLSTFANALRDQAGVSMNQAAINQINAQLTGGI